MQTQEALDRFLKNCEERGVSLSTRRGYQSYLRHFAEEHPELPTDTKIIERFLQKRKETPAHRGDHFKRLQAFLSYLREVEGLPVPKLSKGTVGRPRKVKSVINPASPTLDMRLNPTGEKLVTGGQSVSSSTSISTREAFDKFLRDRERQGVTPATLENYGLVGRRFSREFDELPLTPGPISDFLLSIKGEPETRYFYFLILRAFYYWYLGDTVAKPFVKGFKVGKPKDKIRHTLTTEEFQRFLSLPFSPQEKVMYELLSETQVRASELGSLTRENVYPDHVIVQGKRGQREVPIKPDTYKRLIQLAASGPLFRTPNGVMNRKYLYKITRRWLQRLGVKGVKMGPHLFRHSGAVQYLMFGGDLESLRQHMGHKRITTTQIYAAMSPAEVRKRHMEVDLLGKLQGQPRLTRAICYTCNHKTELDPEKVKEVKCPSCGQVGQWYLPELMSPDQVAAYLDKQEESHAESEVLAGHTHPRGAESPAQKAGPGAQGA